MPFHKLKAVGALPLLIVVYTLNASSPASPCPSVSGVVIVFGLSSDLTTSKKSGTFDLDANGVPDDVSWPTSRSAATAILWMDNNRDGELTDGTELISFMTRLSNGRGGASAEDVFRDLDSNSDGILDSTDAAWSRLRYWRDSDGNGSTRTGELGGLRDIGIASISVAGLPMQASRDKDRVVVKNSFELRMTAPVAGPLRAIEFCFPEGKRDRARD